MSSAAEGSVYTAYRSSVASEHSVRKFTSEPVAPRPDRFDVASRKFDTLLQRRGGFERPSAEDKARTVNGLVDRQSMFNNHFAKCLVVSAGCRSPLTLPQNPADRDDLSDAEKAGLSRFRKYTRNALVLKVFVGKIAAPEGKSIVHAANKWVAKCLTDYGLTHVGLQVDEMVLDWNDGELVIPRDLRSTRAIAVFDVLANLPLNKENLLTICDVVCDFNATKSHHNTTCSVGDVERYNRSNCQGFVNAMLAALGIANTFRTHGCVGQYIDQIVSNPDSAGTFMLTDKEGNQTTHTVRSHAELDALVSNLNHFNEQNTYDTERIDEYLLLKAIDRSFWYKRNSGVPHCEPDGCRFGDPNPTDPSRVHPADVLHLPEDAFSAPASAPSRSSAADQAAPVHIRAARVPARVPAQSSPTCVIL